MDKNNATGLLLISLLLLAYFMFFNPDPLEQPAGQTTGTDSTAVAAPDGKQAAGNAAAPQQPTMPDSLMEQRYGFFALGMKGEGKTVTLENDVMEVTFSTYGAYPLEVKLKKYTAYDEGVVVLLNKQLSYISENISTVNGLIDLNKLYYQVQEGGNTLTFSMADASGRKITRTYALAEGQYTLGYQMDLSSVRNLLNGDKLRYSWANDLKLQEKDMPQSRMRSTINYYYLDGSLDNLSETSEDKEVAEAEQPVRWVSMKQKFFNSALITDSFFEGGKFTSEVPEGSESIVKLMKMEVDIPLESLQDGSANLRYYFGPNDYNICKTVTQGFEENVYLGWAFFSTINLYLIVPMFEFLENYIASYGIIILILVFIVKSVLFPLTYRSYFSMAKMRVLQPEITEIREKYPDDMQKQQAEQMKLYGKVGVNPISGCIPILAQMPVFLAMFNFFPNAIQLRQEGFLWAEDLSTYDSIFNLPFTIPFYGDHVSLFCLLMTVSQVAYTYYNNQMNPQAAMQQGPINMKVISYVTPVMFLFFLNSFSAGLTYYYFISNLITIFQQLIIRRLIDEDKIKAILERNKKKNAGKKSRFQQQLEAMQQKEQEKRKRLRKGK